MLISKFSNCNVEEKVIDIERQYKIILPTQYKNFCINTMGDIRQKLNLK